MSLSVIFGGNRQIIIAADSREVFAERPNQVNHGSVKLFCAGKRTALSIGGLYSVERSGFNARDLVLPLCFNADLQDSPRRLLEAVGDSVFEPIKNFCAKCPDFKAWIYKNGVSGCLFCAYAVKVTSTGMVELLGLSIGLGGRNGKYLQQPEIVTLAEAMPLGPFTYSSGRIATAQVQEVDCVDPDGFTDLIVTQVQRTLSDAILRFDERGEVGGPIDIAAIDPLGGFRWLQNKSQTQPQKLAMLAARLSDPIQQRPEILVGSR